MCKYVPFFDTCKKISVITHNKDSCYRGNHAYPQEIGIIVIIILIMSCLQALEIIVTLNHTILHRMV